MIIKPFHISIAQKIIENYNGKVPFKNHLNLLFKENKNWGSKDRKIYRDLCYKYFRLGAWVKNKLTFEVLNKVSVDFENVIKEINLQEYIPFNNQISSQLSIENVVKTFQTPKKVYLKSLLKNQSKISDFLLKMNIEYTINMDVFIFEKDVNLDEIIENGWGIIMDISSQETINNWNLKGDENLLDVCTGAGGKSIFLKNKFPQLKITNLDIRESILKNYSNRYFNIFKSYPNYYQLDMSKELEINQKFDAILTDVPCSGSGTWGRTPENILYFNEEKISEFQKLQQAILKNSVNLLKPSGKFCYITCSVFEDENEENTKFLINNLGLKQIKESFVQSDFLNSDILYCAQFEKV